MHNNCTKKSEFLIQIVLKSTANCKFKQLSKTWLLLKDLLKQIDTSEQQPWLFLWDMLCLLWRDFWRKVGEGKVGFEIYSFFHPSIRVVALSRVAHSILHTVEFPKIEDRDGKPPFIINPEEEIRYDITRETRDPLHANEIVIQFLAVSG